MKDLSPIKNQYRNRSASPEKIISYDKDKVKDKDRRSTSTTKVL